MSEAGLNDNETDNGGLLLGPSVTNTDEVIDEWLGSPSTPVVETSSQAVPVTVVNGTDVGGLPGTADIDTEQRMDNDGESELTAETASEIGPNTESIVNDNVNGADDTEQKFGDSDMETASEVMADTVPVVNGKENGDLPGTVNTEENMDADTESLPAAETVPEPNSTVPKSEDSFPTVPLECLECCFGFDSMEASTAHFTQIHGGFFGAEAKYCLACSFGFDSLEATKSHFSQTHARVFEDGPEAGKSVESPTPNPKSILEKPLHSVKTVEIFKTPGAITKKPAQWISCRVCGLVLGSQALLRRHRTKYHEYQLRCSVCKKEFRSRDGTLSHVKEAHGRAEAEKQMSLVERLAHRPKSFRKNTGFVCHCARLVFQTETELALHEATTHRYPCKAVGCGIIFNSQRSRNRHAKSHSEAKPE